MSIGQTRTAIFASQIVDIGRTPEHARLDCRMSAEEVETYYRNDLVSCEAAAE